MVVLQTSTSFVLVEMVVIILSALNYLWVAGLKRQADLGTIVVVELAGDHWVEGQGDRREKNPRRGSDSKAANVQSDQEEGES